MATNAELWELKRRRPFQPFRLHLKDGRTYDIPMPACILPGGVSLSLGTPIPGTYDHDDDAPVLHNHVLTTVEWVDRIEMLAPVKGTTP
jgi:hypothetical protein